MTKRGLEVIGNIERHEAERNTSGCTVVRMIARAGFGGSRFAQRLALPIGCVTLGTLALAHECSAGLASHAVLADEGRLGDEATWKRRNVYTTALSYGSGCTMACTITNAPDLFLAGRQIDQGRPLLMGVVNATTDSFSDAGRYLTLQSRINHAYALLGQGADIIDVGGQSAITGVKETSSSDEIGAVVPLIAAILQTQPTVIISIDTYKPSVASAALEAGAVLVNDTSGLRNPELANIVASHGAGLVITHNRSRPKERITEPLLYHDVVKDVSTFLRERASIAIDRGVNPTSIILDPGPDFSKTPYQTIQVLRNVEVFEALGRPVLMAISRKDFIGAIIGRRPSARLAGSLAVIGALGAATNHIYRVHDVGSFRDFLAVYDILKGRRSVSPTLELPVELRRESGFSDPEPR